MTDTHSTQHFSHGPRPIVAKFGGSSVADADQVRKIAAIVRADPRRRFVVVSAPGKRNAKDKKITDLLYLCHSLGEQGLDTAAPFAVIKERYLGIAEELGVPGAWEWLRDMQQQIAAGRGQRLGGIARRVPFRAHHRRIFRRRVCGRCGRDTLRPGRAVPSRRDL